MEEALGSPLVARRDTVLGVSLVGHIPPALRQHMTRSDTLALDYLPLDTGGKVRRLVVLALCWIPPSFYPGLCDACVARSVRQSCWHCFQTGSCAVQMVPFFTYTEAVVTCPGLMELYNSLRHAHLLCSRSVSLTANEAPLCCSDFRFGDCRYVFADFCDTSLRSII